MNPFTLRGAWTRGFGFFAGRPAHHAIVLIGMGLVVPFVLQFLLLGTAISTLNPATLLQQRLGGGAAAGGAMVLIVTLASYALQLGSNFASWRLGLDDSEDLAAAAGYGLLGGVVAILAFVVIGVIGVFVGQAAGVVGVLFVLVALLPLFAALYTALTAALAVMFFVMVLIILAVGAAMGSGNPEASMFGSGGTIALLILFALTAPLLWMTARFGCVAPILADRGSLNLREGVAESWRLTAAAQWRIMLYLGLVGAVLLVALVVVGGLFGFGAMFTMRSDAPAQFGLGAAIAGLIVGIPFAYLVVLIPAGIYRELVRDATPAEVFA